jgi:hypothetical protein
MLNILVRYDTVEFYNDNEWFRICPNITSKFRAIANRKSFVKQMIIQIKRLGMSMIFCCDQHNLSKNKCNGSWIVSIKHNFNCNFWPPSTFVFFVFHKHFLITSCEFFKDLSEYKISWFHVDWFQFTSTSEVCTSVIWENWSHGTEMHGFEVTFNGITSLSNFIKSTNWFKVVKRNA